MDLYSIVPVSDCARSLPWFEVFFGRPADEVIGEEYLWQVGTNAWVVLDDRDLRVGCGRPRGCPAAAWSAGSRARRQPRVSPSNRGTGPGISLVSASRAGRGRCRIASSQWAAAPGGDQIDPNDPAVDTVTMRCTVRFGCWQFWRHCDNVFRVPATAALAHCTACGERYPGPAA